MKKAYLEALFGLFQVFHEGKESIGNEDTTNEVFSSFEFAIQRGTTNPAPCTKYPYVLVVLIPYPS